MKRICLFSIAIFSFSINLSSQIFNHDNIGIGVTGSYTENAETKSITISGSGADVWGTTDQFYFAYMEMPVGNVDVICRITSLENTHASAKAGIMIRDELTPTSAHAITAGHPSNEVTYQLRLTDGANMIGGGPLHGTGLKYIRMIRSGTQMQSYYAEAGGTTAVKDLDWLQLPGTFQDLTLIGDKMYVGLFVCSHAGTSVEADAVFDSVFINEESVFIPTFTVTTIAGTGGTVDPSGSTTYSKGDTATITAIPDSGYNFIGWTGSATETTPTLKFEVNADMTLLANFDVASALNSTDEELFIIYPNPVTEGVLNINTPAKDPMIISLFDYSGKFIDNFYIDKHNNRIDINGLPSGLYMLKAINQNGKSLVKSIVLN